MAKTVVANSPLDKVLTYQTTVAGTKAKRNNLRKIISDKENEISGMASLPSTLPELTERQENILADIVLGVNRQTELDQVNAEITAETKRLTDHAEALNQATETAAPALAGLRRKLAGIDSELSALKGLNTEHVLDVLKEEAEQIAVEYVKSVSAMAAKVTQLRALCNAPTSAIGLDFDFPKNVQVLF
jgi:chromosome segregation ATPase